MTNASPSLVDDRCLRAFIAAANFGLWTFDHARQRFRRDATFMALLGWRDAPADEQGLTLEALLAEIHPDDQANTRMRLLDLHVLGDTPFDTECRLCRAEGDWLWIRLHGRAVETDPTGRPMLTVGLARSIAGFKRADERLEKLVAERTVELEDARHKAEMASRAKSAFLSNMSHEIRTPLNAIIGFAHLLERGNLEPYQRELVGKVGRAGDQLLDIINDVLDLSRIESGRLKLQESDFELRGIFDKVHALIDGQAAAKGLRITYDLPAEPLWMRGDAARLGQIMLTFASNAVKFTERGEITLSVRILERNRGDALLRFEVRDTGIGMTARQQARIFEPFEKGDDSTSRRHGGMGMGLALSSHLARMMSATLGVDSQPDLGSTFWLTLRLPFGEPGPRAASTPNPEPPPVVNTAEDAAVLGEVPGLDLERGLKSVSGRMVSYRRLLRLFLDAHIGDANRMREYLTEGQSPALQQTAHALKGTAATLGATELQALAAAVEQAVRESAGEDVLATRIASVSTCLSRFMPALQDALARLDGTPSGAPTAVPANRNEWRAVLDQIEHLLRDDDMTVNAACRSAEAMLRDMFGAERATFDALIQRFDYAAALEWLLAQRADRHL